MLLNYYPQQYLPFGVHVAGLREAGRVYRAADHLGRVTLDRDVRACHDIVELSAQQRIRLGLLVWVHRATRPAPRYQIEDVGHRPSAQNAEASSVDICKARD